MLDRRRFLAACSGLGLGSTLFPGTLWALAQGKPAIPREMIGQAGGIAGVTIPDDSRRMMLDNLNEQAQGYEAIYALHLPNTVEPCLLFDPVLPGAKFETTRRPMRLSQAPHVAARGVPRDLEEVAFWSLRELSDLVKTRKVSPSALTEMYLARLQRLDPLLKFNATPTTDRARAQAKEADRDVAAGRYRGPLHGMPWGAKDLLAVKGDRTTWGAGGFEEQTIDEDATVVQRLDAAGATRSRGPTAAIGRSRGRSSTGTASSTGTGSRSATSRPTSSARRDRRRRRGERPRSPIRRRHRIDRRRRRIAPATRPAG